MARIRVDLKGLHRVRKRLSNGEVAEYHYAWRGGPRIWDKSKPFRPGSVEYVEAFREATTRRHDSSGTFQEVIEAFLSSSEFAALGERTKLDHRKNIVRSGGIEEAFGKAPRKAFEDKPIRPQIMNWRDGFSAGTGDNMMATMQRIVSFAYQRGLVGEHHLLRLKKRKKTNRAGVVWMPDEIQTIWANAPRYVGRILVAAVETGLRPGDLASLTWKEIEKRPGGASRILLRTRKSGGSNYASIPVTPRMAELIDEIPRTQTHLIVGERGKPFADSNRLGRAVHEWRDTLNLRKELRLYDARGTAVTRLVRAGCTLAELATHMGWSLQHAAHMLEKYAALDPDMSDGIAEKIARRARRDAGDDS